MSWQQLVCHTTLDHQQAIVAAMEAEDALAVTWQDAEDAPILEPKPGEIRLWDKLIITALYPAEHDLTPLLLLLQAQREAWGIQALRHEMLAEQAWERAWMDSFQPMCFGQRLWIYPSSHALPADGSIKLLLDPGLAFGTGTHPTTALCLEWLDNQDLRGKTVLDYGCGSGVLALAALKLGATYAVATDIDPQALQATQTNAERNGIPAQQLHTCYPEALPQKQYDIVMANILAGPLEELAPHLLGALRPAGDLVLSGILATQTQALQNCYQPHLDDFSITQKEEWIRITGKLR